MMRMQRFGSALVLGLALSTLYAADAVAAVDYEWLLTSPKGPATVTVSSPPTSQTGVLHGIYALNNSGMSSTVYPTDTHSIISCHPGGACTNGDMWESLPNDAAPEIKIDLKEVHPIGKVLIWNYANYNSWGSFSGRGIKDCIIDYGDGVTWTPLIAPGGDANGKFTLAKASDAAPPAPPAERRDPPSNLYNTMAPIDFAGKPARFIRIRPIVGPNTCGTGQPCGNWGGAAGETAKYYGLSEIRVYRHGRNTTAATNDSYIPARTYGASSYAGDAWPSKVTSNYGMSDVTTVVNGNYTTTATVLNNTAKWISANGDTKPYIMFDLGGTYPISQMAVWNLNVNVNGVDMRNKGLKQVDIWYSLHNDWDNWNQPVPLTHVSRTGTPWKKLTSTSLAKATQGTNQAATNTISFLDNGVPVRARYVVIIPTGGFNVGNHGDPQSYGLSQVRFYAGTGLTAEPAPYWEGLVAQRTTTTTGYVFGDGSYSIKTTFGGVTRSLWLFDDPACGVWNPVTYAPTAMPCSHNAWATYTGPATPKLDPALNEFKMQTDFGGDTINPASSYWPNDEFFWIQGGYQDGNNVYLGALRREVVPDTTTSDPNDFRTYARSFDIIRAPLTTGGIPDYDLVNDPAQNNQFVTGVGSFPNNHPNAPDLLAETGFPSQMVKFSDGFVYVYGWRGTQTNGTELIVGRFLPQNYNNTALWKFHAGTSTAWVDGTLAQAKNILPTGGYSGVWGNVTTTPTGWDSRPFMYTTAPKKGGIPEPVSVAFAQNPWGPFSAYTRLFSPAPTTFSHPPPNGDPTVFPGSAWYASTTHSEVSRSGEAIVTTNLSVPANASAVHGSTKFYRVRKL